MNDELTYRDKPMNKQRRSLLQGAMCVGAASFAPGVFGKALTGNSDPSLSGKLVCSISDPVKTLVLRNHCDKSIVISQLSKGAFMFDGSIVDCNAACLAKPITIAPNQEIQVKFDKRKQSVIAHRADEFRRIQSRVTRLNDGTRVIPFVAKLEGDVATVI